MWNYLQKSAAVCVLLNYLLLNSLNAQEPAMLRPVGREISLSGNFGELRSTHFHAGLDFRTGGMEGLPVVCVKDGLLARVRVSPVGYGQALYVEHADGTTTVYGHLQRFVPVVSALVREIQYQKESFDIDEGLKLYNIYLHRGDTIAYSGNTGSSGGPHLHFEVRNTRSEHTVNPLHYYKIRDNIAPKVKAVYVYRISEQGCVSMIRQRVPGIVSSGQSVCDEVTVPPGKIGIAVFAEDYMNDSGSKLGIYSLDLKADGRPLFHMQVDSCSFDQSCLVNELKDFDRYKKKETAYRCFGNYQNQILGVRNYGGGVIRVGRDSVHKIRISLADINGNRTEVALSVRGGIPQDDPEDQGDILKYDQGHCLEFGNGYLRIDAGALAYSVKKVLRTGLDSITGLPFFVFSETDVPLLKKAELFVAGTFSPQTVICEVNGNKKYPLKTLRDSTGLYAGIGYLNRYALAEDRVLPVITYLGIGADRRLRFRIKDNMTGIACYRGEVNGKWCLFAYDAKNDLFSCSLKEPVFVKGKPNKVAIMLEDGVGNRREYVKIVKI